METTVYLAGGMNDFNSDWREDVKKKILDSKSKGKGFVFFNPKQHELTNSKEYTIWDLYYVQKCDILFAYMQKENPSGYGLTLEVGFARALGRPIILVDEKSNHDPKFDKFFKIVRESASIVFEDLNEGIKFLQKFKNGIVVL